MSGFGKFKGWMVAAVFFFGGTGCRAPQLRHVLVQPDSLTFEKSGLRSALDRSIAAYGGAAFSKSLSMECYSADDRLRTLLWVRDLLEESSSESQFVSQIFHEAAFLGWDPGVGSTLVTGYFEPVVPGSLQRSEEYRYPLYRVPPQDELRQLSRAEIDGEMKLEGRGLELVWLKSALDAFFLHIQGSGKIQLPSGELLNVGYAGKNGRPYKAIGSVLVAKGLLSPDQVSMQSIRALLDEHAELLEQVLFTNESYVYFERRNRAAVGSAGVELVAWASLASDPLFIPSGSLALLRSAVGEPFRLLVSLDTGGAVKGPHHVDVFTGTGEGAGSEAGLMKSRGELYLIRWPGQCGK